MFSSGETEIFQILETFLRMFSRKFFKKSQFSLKCFQERILKICSGKEFQQQILRNISKEGVNHSRRNMSLCIYPWNPGFVLVLILVRGLSGVIQFVIIGVITRFVNHEYDYRPTSDDMNSTYQLIIKITIFEKHKK